eukprot:TRINITY_DN24262_c0_g1_i1.p1 TRINITY_DN24262_c0_g1~~TRINITY_DN24262_c0_g1_i1.p1  ORF type:complete len:344 (+),score=100.16 TRINITY_DN24262_c0_g1_i1:72-1034(+)
MARKKSQSGRVTSGVPLPPTEGNPLCYLRLRWQVAEDAEPTESELIFELMRDRLPATCDNFLKLLVGLESADKKNPKTLGYKGTPLFRFTDKFVQGGLQGKLETPVRPPGGWPAGYWAGQESASGPVLVDERVWEELPGRDAGTQYDRGTFAADADERPFTEKDLDTLKKHCLQGVVAFDGRQRRFGAFVVRGGKAYFRQQTASQCAAHCQPADDCSLWIPDAGPNRITHTFGTLTMAHSGHGTAASQFCILTADAPYLDGKYCAFGKLVSGEEQLALLHAGILPLCDERGYVPSTTTAVIVDGGPYQRATPVSPPADAA